MENAASPGGHDDFNPWRADGNRKAERAPLHVLETVFRTLQPVYHGRQDETQDISWRMTDREYPISLTNAEGLLLYRAICRNRLRSGYDVATGIGVSSYWAGLAMKETGGALVSVDDYVHDCWVYRYQGTNAPSEGMPSCLRFARESATQLGLSAVISYRIGTSLTPLSADLAERRFDYVYIDGRQTGGWPLKAFRVVASFLSERCLVAFHDNLPTGDVPDAVAAAATYLGSTPVVLPTRHNLTLVGRGVILETE